MDLSLDALGNLESVMDGILDSVDIFEINDLTFNEFDLQAAPDHQPTEGSDSDSGISVSGEKNIRLDFPPVDVLNLNQLSDQPSRTGSDEILTDVIYRSDPKVSVKPEDLLGDSNLPHTNFQQRVTPLTVNGPIRLVKVGGSNSLKVKTLVQSSSLTNTNEGSNMNSKTDTVRLYSSNLQSNTNPPGSMTFVPPSQRQLTIPTVKVTPTAIVQKDSLIRESIPFSNSHNLTVLNDFCPILEEYDGMKYSDSSLEHHISGRSVTDMHSVDLLLTQSNLDRIHKKQERMIKNRHAASLSRLRKKEYLERLEMRYEHLKRENLHLWRQNEEWRLRCVHLERCMDDLQSRLSSISREGGDQQGLSLLPPASQYQGQPPRSHGSVDLLSTGSSSGASPGTVSPSSIQSSASLTMTSLPVTTNTAPRVSLSTLASNNVGFGRTVKEFYPPSSSKSSVSLFASPVDSRLAGIRASPPPTLPVRKHASIGLYNRSGQHHLSKATTSQTSLYKSYTATAATAASSLLLGQRIAGGVIAKRPRLVATTTTSLLAILCLFSVNTLLLPRAPWASSSETGFGHYRPGNNIGHVMSNGAGRRVLLSLPEVDPDEPVAGDNREWAVSGGLPATTRSNRDDSSDSDDYTTIDCTKAGNQSNVGDGCQITKDGVASRAKSTDNSSMDDPDKVLQNWIQRNRRPVDEVPRSTRGLRNQRFHRSLRSNPAQFAPMGHRERGLQSAQPFYRYPDGDGRGDALDVEALLLEAAYMIHDTAGGLDKEYGSGARGNSRQPHRRNVVVNKNNTVYLLLSGVDFTIIHIPSSQPANSSNSRDKVARQKMTFILPDNSRPAASFDETKDGDGDHFPPTGNRTYQLLQLDCELINATRISSPVPELHRRSPGGA